MLIMPTSDVNFQAYADNIAGEFFSKGTPLADGIVKVARENEFTPEEVKRLLEKTNTAASLQHLKTAEDKKATFTLANLDLVIKELFPGESVSLAKEATYKGIPNTRCKIAQFVKEASTETPAEKPEIDAYQAFDVVTQARDNLALQKIACESDTQALINSLAQTFARRKPEQFAKFAADCHALYGKTCTPVLSGISGYLNLELAKTASEGIVDDTGQEFAVMKKICTNLERHMKLSSELSALNDTRDNIWMALKNSVHK